MVYFDHNATTPTDERVVEAMIPFLKTFYGNPSSLYRHGRLVRTAIDTARAQVAALVGARPDQIIFTSGGTEANNLALSSITPTGRFAISAIEHPSVTEPAIALANKGNKLRTIPVTSEGLVSITEINEIIQFKPELVSIMLANNETGVIQDTGGYWDLLRAQGILVHTDAVQALGKIKLNFNESALAMMSISSHKIYGPKGSGALVVSKEIKIKPQLLGGNQEFGFRAGTENVPAIIGFGKAAELAAKEFAQRTDYLYVLKKLLEERLNQLAQRLPNTVQFGYSGIDGEMLLMQLDQKGIAVSSGSACASGGGKPSAVLSAMGLPEELAKSAIRISLGKDNTETEIIQFTDLLASLLKKS
jgi:cysteine desulfurase